MGSVLRSDLQRTELIGVVRDATGGQSDAVDELIRYCLPQVEAYLARRGAAHPEALANLVMAEFVGNLPRLDFSTPEQLWSYLYRVSRSRLLDEKRRARPDQPTEYVDAADPRASLFDDNVVDRMWMTDLLSGLTEAQREVVELRFKDDLTLEETANRTGRSLTAVKGLQRRALAALAAAAAIAAVVLIVVLAAKLLLDSNVNVQSLEPAEVSGTESNSADQRGSGEPGAIAVGGITGPGDEDAGGVGGTDSTDEGRGDDGAPLPVVDTSLPADLALLGAPIGDAAIDGLEIESVGSVIGQTLNPEATTTTAVPTQSSTTSIPSSTTTPVPPIPTTGLPTSTTVPGPPPFVMADSAGFTNAPGGPAWTEIDVLYNDDPAVNAKSIRLVNQPASGLAEVVAGADGPVVRYYPTGPGDAVFAYEACGPEGCQVATIAVAVRWYTDAMCEVLTPTIIGTPGDDVLQGTEGADVIFGLAGDDTITGAGGDDIICAGAGDDIVDGNDGGDIIFGGPGEDDLVGNGGSDVLYGGDGPDFLDGDGGSDQIYGGPGNDSITGGGMSDILFGEQGDDRLVGNGNGDTIFGGSGSDVILGLGGADLLHGGPDADVIEAGNDVEPDRLFGGAGQDRLTGGSPDDTLDGQHGTDTCTVGTMTNCE